MCVVVLYTYCGEFLAQGNVLQIRLSDYTRACWVCCVALPCCLFHLACFFLPSFSHLSLRHVYVQEYEPLYGSSHADMIYV